MSNIIQSKHSSVDGKIPLVGDLTLGEIAVNTFNGKMFIKKDDGTESIVEIGAGGGSQELKTYDFTSSAGQTDFIVTGLVFSKASVYSSGIRDKESTYTITDDGTDTTVSFDSGKSDGTWVLIEVLVTT